MLRFEGGDGRSPDLRRPDVLERVVPDDALC